MRRATQTGLLAFEAHVREGCLPVIAHELCHETGGKHTCDKRLDRADLKREFPSVDYSFLSSESDPLWGDGLIRESGIEMSKRCADLMLWVSSRKERQLVVAAHSGFLVTLFNAVLDIENPDDSTWFGTGEMRTMVLDFSDGSN